MRTYSYFRTRRFRRLLLVSLVFLAAIGVFFWYKLFRTVITVYADPLENFKYGSIGTEVPAGIPYWIWVVLPRIFPDKLPGPGGYVALGASWEMGKELPIGFTKEIVGMERVGVNCAGCHTTSVRSAPDQAPQYYFGGPTTRFQPQGYVRFLFACARDDRFTSTNIMNAILEIYNMPFVDQVLYRYLVIPATKSAILQSEKKGYYWMASRPDWGPGRTDMNPFQRQVLGLPDDHTVGSTDVMPIWNENAHEGMLHHSDGLNTTLIESSRAAALAAGATKSSIDIPSIDKTVAWLRTLQPPPYAFALDQALAAKGQPIFAAHCAGCHAFGGARTGTVVSLQEVGTDPHRNKHWSPVAAADFNVWADGYSWAFHHFRTSDGYASMPLDGV
jgi:mono/diheme cytochrome c family protein